MTTRARGGEDKQQQNSAELGMKLVPDIGRVMEKKSKHILFF